MWLSLLLHHRVRVGSSVDTTNRVITSRFTTCLHYQGCVWNIQALKKVRTWQRKRCRDHTNKEIRTNDALFDWHQLKTLKDFFSVKVTEITLNITESTNSWGSFYLIGKNKACSPQVPCMLTTVCPFNVHQQDTLTVSPVVRSTHRRPSLKHRLAMQNHFIYYKRW